jgi:hypothetical protein
MNKPTCCLDKKTRIDFMKKGRMICVKSNQIISHYGNPTNNLRHCKWQDITKLMCVPFDYPTSRRGIIFQGKIITLANKKNRIN